MKNAKKQTIYNFIWSAAAGAAAQLLNFIIAPYVAEKAGIEAYGFISLGTTLTSYINIISSGLNAYSSRYIAVSYHNKRIDEANSYYSSVLGANLILAGISVAAGCCLIVRLEKLIKIPEYLTYDVKLLFLFVLLNYLLGLISTVYGTAAFIKNRLELNSAIKCISLIIYALVVLLSFHFAGVHIYFAAFSSMSGTLFLLAGNYYISGKLAPELKAKVSLYSAEKVKRLLIDGIYCSINSLGGTLCGGLDLLITNKYLTNSAMGQIAVANQIGTFMVMAVNLTASIFQPRQLEDYAKEDMNSLVKRLLLSMKICGFIANVFWIYFLFAGLDFLNVWIPNQNTKLIYDLVIIVILGYMFASIVTPLYYIPVLAVKMKTVCFMMLGVGTMNVLSMIVLLKYTEYGALIIAGTTAVLSLTVVFAYPILGKKYLKLNENPFVNTIVRFFINAAIIAALCAARPFRFKMNHWLSLIGSGIILLIIESVLFWFIQIEKKDRQAIKHYIILKYRR